MNLEECYEAMESNYDDVMRRLGSETAVSYTHLRAHET